MLSHKFSVDDQGTATNILPSSCIAGVKDLETEHVICNAQGTEPNPGMGPQNCLFVPESVKKQVLNCHKTNNWMH